VTNFVDAQLIEVRYTIGTLVLYCLGSRNVLSCSTL
jgi:hypothetical protein